MEKNINENEIIDVLEQTFFSYKPVYLFEHTTEDAGKYDIETYLPKKDLEDKKYVSSNRKKIKEFFDAGYKRAGLGNFLGCSTSNSVKDNTSMLKVAREHYTGQIICMTIYSSRWGGFKCVGGTVIDTDDHDLRVLGVQALQRLTREDTKLWHKFIWTECSGNIEAYWENAGGIRIPAAYITLFMDSDTLKDIELDEDNPYVYTRVIARGEPHEQRIQKTIFGFPNQTVLDKYIEDQNTTLEEMCKKYGIDIDELNEGVMYRYAPEKIWPHLKLLKYYCESVFKKERMEITQKECEVLTKAVRISYEVIAPVWERTNDKHIQDIYRLILRFAMELNRCNILRPYELGEYLELETEKFPTYKLMPTAF